VYGPSPRLFCSSVWLEVEFTAVFVRLPFRTFLPSSMRFVPTALGLYRSKRTGKDAGHVSFLSETCPPAPWTHSAEFCAHSLACFLFSIVPSLVSSCFVFIPSLRDRPRRPVLYRHQSHSRVRNFFETPIDHALPGRFLFLSTSLVALWRVLATDSRFLFFQMIPLRALLRPIFPFPVPNLFTFF